MLSTQNDRFHPLRGRTGQPREQPLALGGCLVAEDTEATRYATPAQHLTATSPLLDIRHGVLYIGGVRNIVFTGRILLSLRHILPVLVLIPASVIGCSGSGGTKDTTPVPTRTVHTRTTTASRKSVPPTSADREFLAGRYDAARKLYLDSVVKSPENLDHHDGLIRSALKCGKMKETLKWYEKQLSRKGTAGWSYGAARAMLQSGDREQSSTLCYNILRTRPNMGRAYFLLGLKYGYQSVPNYKSSAKSFEKAIQFEPAYGPSYYHLARFEFAGVGPPQQSRAALRAAGKKHLASAIALCRAVEKNVKYKSHVLLGAVLSGENNFHEALRQFDEARKIDARQIHMDADIGRVYELMGDNDRAIKEWSKVQEMFGLASHEGLKAYRSAHKIRSKVAIDYRAFLPTGSDSDYRVLVQNLETKNATPSIRVPTNIAGMLDRYKSPVKMIRIDLDGDQKDELIVVEAVNKWDPTRRTYSLAGPILYVFTQRGGNLAVYDSKFDQMWDVKTVDFDKDGKKEIVFVAFNNPNIFNIIVMTHQGDRLKATFAQPVKCVTPACGVFVDDLDDDGKMEIMTVSGEDLWVTVWRWEKSGTFKDSSADFPRFYLDYVKRYGKLTPDQLKKWPMVERHLIQARKLAAGTAR